jgi:hypothetical protein
MNDKNIASRRHGQYTTWFLVISCALAITIFGICLILTSLDEDRASKKVMRDEIVRLNKENAELRKDVEYATNENIERTKQFNELADEVFDMQKKIKKKNF